MSSSSYLVDKAAMVASDLIAFDLPATTSTKPVPTGVTPTAIGVRNFGKFGCKTTSTFDFRTMVAFRLCATWKDQNQNRNDT